MHMRGSCSDPLLARPWSKPARSGAQRTHVAEGANPKWRLYSLLNWAGLL
jgi:hypothetical protein